MILASRQPNGKVQFFNAFTGARYKPDRETGRYLGHIPDDVLRFLFFRKDDKQGFLNSERASTCSASSTQNNAPKPEFIEGWLLKLIAWFKSLFSNGKRK